MSKLVDKVAIVTGASKGIGASIATHLAAEGAAVVVNYATSREGADRVVAEIIGNGGKAIAVKANVAVKSEIERLFAETKKAFGKLDILVNNAGIYEFSPLEGITEQHFHKQFDLNVLGLILTSQEAVKHFGSNGGSIINISSVVATLAPPERRGVQRDQGGRRCGYKVAGQGAGPTQDPHQLDQPRHGGDRRNQFHRDHRERYAPPDRSANAARPNRTAARHRHRGGLPCLIRCFLDYRRDALHLRRIPVSWREFHPSVILLSGVRCPPSRASHLCFFKRFGIFSHIR